MSIHLSPRAGEVVARSAASEGACVRDSEPSGEFPSPHPLPACGESGEWRHCMLTILFDGIAYGMLLFVLACGLSVTLGLMNFVNLAHGAFAMAGGYCRRRPGQPHGRAVPARAAARLPGDGGARRPVRAHALCPRLCQEPLSTRCCSPSASCSCRWRPSTTSWARSSSSCSFPTRCRASSTCSASASASIGCSSSWSAAC